MEIKFGCDEIWSFNSMITSLYQTTNKKNAVFNFLNSLKQFCFFEKGDVYIYKIVDGHLRYDTFVFTGWGKELSTYMNYREIDDVLPIVSTPQSLVFRSSDIFIDLERQKTEYYKKVLKPCLMDYSIEGNLYYEADEVICGFCLHRQKKYDDFSNKELEFVKLAKPHLANFLMPMCESSNFQTTFFKDDLDWHSNSMAVWVIGDDFVVQSVDLGESESIKMDYKKINSTLQAICRNMNRAKAKKYPSTIEELRDNCKIILDSKPYYVEIIYTSQFNDPGNYTCIVYDYTMIFNNLLEDLKCRYHLSAREFEILKYMFDGLDNSEISKELFLSVSTVKKYAVNLYQKLGIEGRHQLFHMLI